jgi:bifunctional non-homologous end joining protein LigD
VGLPRVASLGSSGEVTYVDPSPAPLGLGSSGPAVRLFTRRGYGWTERYPAIAAAAAKLRARSFTLDGEAVVCGLDGVAVFDALHRRRQATDAMLYAFHLLELDGVDYRPLSLNRRKDRLARLLARVPAGIALNDHTDAKGDLVFRQACCVGWKRTGCVLA